MKSQTSVGREVREANAVAERPVPTVFVDRDGVINRKREGDYVRNWAQFEFLPGAKDALRLLTESGHRVIVVTNQRGIARGLMTEADLAEIHERMIGEAAAAGAFIAAVYFCPHESGECTCRKPNTGMFLQAQRDFPDINFPTAAVIGDSASDIAAGTRLGCRNILVGDDADHECAASLYDAVVEYLA
jgi:D-glycero-D-manno-heptose 1,7-bisphosphate phosphatase